jgi:hypothetical protein
MQPNFCSPLQFLQRTDALASVLACNLNDLPEKIGISERSLYGYRVGKYPVTAKALRKLEASERAAGIRPSSDENAESSRDVKDHGIGESAHSLREESPRYRAKADEVATAQRQKPPRTIAADPALQGVLERIAAALESLVEMRENSKVKDPKV